MMLYLSVKAAHLIAVMIWMTGMLAAPLAVGLLGDDATHAQRRRLKALFTRVVTPSMLIALGLGVWLMVLGNWFDAGWMQGKLVAVIGMTAVHGMLSGTLRRYASGGGESFRRRLNAIELVSLLLMMLIALLATTKAFT